jgi:ParB family transcriptional regulator, chromosome partitioning protein
MSKRGGGWRRQSWQDAASEIGQALEPTAQPGEELRQIDDAQIDDSPYQARVSYNDEQIAELAQGMAESGFQGVLFVRPHPGGPQGGRERYQLVYGHRRRQAWRSVCAGRGAPCMLPAIVRPFSDREMLTVGAQENLQREDLNPMEEARLVAWHQELYYPAGLGEIGRMLGKSEDWAKTRSRLAQLPEALQAAVWRSPALMTAALEIARLWAVDPAQAEALAARAEGEGLNLRQIRQIVAAALAPARPDAPDDLLARPAAPLAVLGAAGGAEHREAYHDRRVDPLNVTKITTEGPDRQIEAEAEEMIARLRRWQRQAGDSAVQAAIGRSCERILGEIQQIINQIAAS